MREFSAPENVKILKNEPLSRYSSMRTGGPAAMAAFPKSTESLILLVRAASEQNIRYLVAGNATNLLFDDRGFDGLVIFTKGLRGVTWNKSSVTAECGVSLTALSRDAAARGLSGLEFAYGIPGTVGGAVYMNAGAYGSEIADILTASDYLKGCAVLSRRYCDHAFSYRSSIYRKTGEIILSATFAMTPGDSAAIRTLSKKNMTARREKQPLEYPNAGSIFKRPPCAYAGALIENAGLKGMRIGGAEVSEKHAGFIINRGGATTDDVLRLIEYIRSDVLKKTGVLLEPEVIHIPY